MQIKIFTIPIVGGEELVEEMNGFLRSKKVLQMEQSLVNTAEGSYWSFCVRYIEDIKKSGYSSKRTKVDYKYLLDEDSFGRFSKMREIRKQISKEQAIPAYAVFTDAELAELAKMEVLTPENIKGVEGIGEKKVEKYGQYFVNQKSVLKCAYRLINDYIEGNLRGELKPLLLNHSRRGLPFVGYKIYPNKVLLTQRSKRRFTAKMQQIDKMYDSGEWTEAECQRKVLPLLNFISYADSYSFRKSVLLDIEKEKILKTKGQVS